ncbi:DUF732 domain-containing protein [Mycobacterium sp.]|uniref:DUF732 domain-containing protein n=1 Tax=Mycobacterium sp. TaxID=1785 RepID=UPI0031D50DDE
MFTGITLLAGVLVSAVVDLTGAAILGGAPAAADPGQDQQFLALLNQEGIPAVKNNPSLIATAHKVCRELDGGMPADDLVDQMRNRSYQINPIERLLPDRVTRTVTRFISAAVGAYCPRDQGRIASMSAGLAHGSAAPAGRDLPGAAVVELPFMTDGGVVVAGRYPDGGRDRDAHVTVLVPVIRVVPSGDIVPTDPPEIPPPPPPQAQIQKPLPAVAAPPAPKQAPAPPQQAEPPEVAPPAPGIGGGPDGIDGTGGNGAGGGAGGAGPEEPEPDPGPGWVRMAP